MSKQKDATHHLPGWFLAIQRHVVLTLLIIGEFVVNMGLAIRLVTHDYAHPETWNWYEWTSALTLGLAAGLAAAGVAVALSQAVADSFAQGRPIRALFLMAGLFAFCTIEVWGNLVERSVDARPSPLDMEVMRWAAIEDFPVTPSAIAFSLFLPLSAMFYGFTSRPKQAISDEEFEQQQQRKLRQAEFNAKINATRMSGLASGVRGALESANVVKPKAKPASVSDANPEGLTGASEQIDAAPGRSSTGLPNAKGPWNKKDILRYLALEYPHISIGEPALMRAMKTEMGGFKQGTQLVADIRAVRPWARRFYGAPASESLSISIEDSEAVG